eukprot:scaffold75116_cov63-Phaeocystis_antarctica.AAC.3
MLQTLCNPVSPPGHHECREARLVVADRHQVRGRSVSHELQDGRGVLRCGDLARQAARIVCGERLRQRVQLRVVGVGRANGLQRLGVQRQAVFHGLRCHRSIASKLAFAAGSAVDGRGNSRLSAPVYRSTPWPPAIWRVCPFTYCSAQHISPFDIVRGQLPRRQPSHSLVL